MSSGVELELETLVTTATDMSSSGDVKKVPSFPDLHTAVAASSVAEEESQLAQTPKSKMDSSRSVHSAGTDVAFIQPDIGTPAAEALVANAAIRIGGRVAKGLRRLSMKRPSLNSADIINKLQGKKKVNKKADGKNFKGKVIDGVHELYTLTMGMMLGLRCSVVRYRGATGVLRMEDFNFVEKRKFPPAGSPPNASHPTPAHSLAHTFRFKTYAPRVFQKIRDFFNIETDSYMNSVCGDCNYLEFISNSKSGQFFFYSHDGKYMIKTQTNEENKFMKKILLDYYGYIRANPNTMLVRILGMHRVSMYHLKRKVHFVIMASVFDTPQPIHSIYDLKGSLIGREATAEERNKGGVLKDLDLIKDKVKFHLGKKRENFLAQLERDANFLATLNIMDYSLLVGIHDRKKRVLGQRLASFTSATGALVIPHSNLPFRQPFETNHLRNTPKSQRHHSRRLQSLSESGKDSPSTSEKEFSPQKDQQQQPHLRAHSFITSHEHQLLQQEAEGHNNKSNQQTELKTRQHSSPILILHTGPTTGNRTPSTSWDASAPANPSKGVSSNTDIENGNESDEDEAVYPYDAAMSPLTSARPPSSRKVNKKHIHDDTSSHHSSSAHSLTLSNTQHATNNNKVREGIESPRSIVSVNSKNRVDDGNDDSEDENSDGGEDYYEGEDDSDSDGDSDSDYSYQQSSQDGTSPPVEFMGKVSSTGISTNMFNQNRASAPGSESFSTVSTTTTIAAPARPRRLTDYFFASRNRSASQASRTRSDSQANATPRQGRVSSISSLFSGKSREDRTHSNSDNAGPERYSIMSYQSSVGSNREYGDVIASKSSTSKPWTKRHDGGINSQVNGVRGDHIYYLGVIDILQRYNMNKRVETFFKSFTNDSSKISSVNSKFYAKRFVEFIRDNSD